MNQKYDPERHHRRSIRLAGYDYTQVGAYFVTICSHERECRFGNIVDDGMQINPEGEIVRVCWEGIPAHFPHVELDEFVVMPNHMHGILLITPKQEGATGSSLGVILGSFKSAVTKRINQLHETSGIPVWQRSYYEHVIRDERELNGIRQYIVDNPLKWALDDENPTRTKR